MATEVIKNETSSFKEININTNNDSNKMDIEEIRMNIDIIKQTETSIAAHKDFNKIDNENDNSDSEARNNRKKVPEEVINKVLNDQNKNKDDKKSENDKKAKEQEDRNEQLKKLLKKVPKKKKEVFAFNLNWDTVVKHELVEGKMHPWLKKKSMELFGNEETVFIDLILKKLRNKEKPEEVAKRLEKVLDEDSMKFVAEMWRTLIFETLKAECFS